MTLKEKLKVIALTAIGGVLAYCGFNKQEKSDGGISRESKEWTVNPKQLTLGKCDTVLFSNEDRPKNFHLGRYGDSEGIHQERDDDSSEKMSARLTKALQQQNIAIEKEGSLLRSVDYVDGKFSNPVYEVNPKVEVKTSSIEKAGDVDIRRNGGNTVITTLDPATIAISNEKDDSYEEHFYKLRKVVNDKKIEKELHKGDTIDYAHELQWAGLNNFVLKKKQAIVEKDGVSPTYKEESTKEHNVLKLNFNYAKKKGGIGES